MSTSLRSLLRLSTINSDESMVADATRTVALLNPDTGKPMDGPTATVALISDERYKEIVKRHREPDRSSSRVEWITDMDKVTLQILAESVQSWGGVVGADGRPVPISGAVLKALDFFNKTHLAGVARTPAEMVDAEVVAASFRQPPVVVGVG